MTVTLVCNHYPVKMISYLEGKLGTRAERQEGGIYYINGGLFPLQILINNQLSRKENLWLSRLHGGLTSEEDLPLLTEAYIENREDPLYDAAMNLILSANKKQLEEVAKMGELVNKVFADLIEDLERRAEENAIEKAIEKVRAGVEAEVKAEVIAEGEQRLADLFKALLQDGRTEEFLSAVEEVEYRQQLYEEYRI